MCIGQLISCIIVGARFSVAEGCHSGGYDVAPVVEGRENSKHSPCDSRWKENIDRSQSQQHAGKTRSVQETARGRNLYYRSTDGNRYKLQPSPCSQETSDLFVRNFAMQ
jgi:hypothetical protein